ncbi:MAG: NAD(P)/FAD-dependent oxidoreductase [bacterium]
MQKFDVGIIGAGTGGYRAAELLSGRGKSVVIFEKSVVGGVCLNWGCIPTKAMVASAELLEEFKASEKFGIKSSFEVDFSKIMARKERIVKMLTMGLSKKLLSKGIKIVNKEAYIKDLSMILCGDEEYSVGNIIIATGSYDAGLRGIDFDNENILSSKEILSLKDLPKRLSVIGAGVIGSEFSSVFAFLGSKVTLMEYFPKPFYSTKSSIIMNEGEKILKKSGIDLRCSTTVSSVDKESREVILSTGERIQYDKLLVATGRKPVVNDDVKKLGIALTDKGFIETNEKKETNIKGVYAVGDCTDGPMLAHKAYYDSYIAACAILGEEEKQMDMCMIPYSIFIIPSISHCGKSEDMCVEERINFRKIESSYAENGRAAAYEARQGSFTMLIGEDDRILGATIVGRESDTLLHEIIPLMHNNIPYTALKRSVHIHPTLSEIIAEGVI